MLDEDIQYVEKITAQIRDSGVEGGALMRQLIEALARNLQLIAVVGSSSGTIDLLSNMQGVISKASERLDAMHEALVAGLALAKDLDEQGVAEKAPIPKEKSSIVSMDISRFADAAAIIKERMTGTKEDKNES